MEQSSTAIESGYPANSSKRGDLVVLIGLAAITLISVITAVSGLKKKKKRKKNFSGDVGKRTPAFVEQVQPVK